MKNFRTLATVIILAAISAISCAQIQIGETVRGNHQVVRKDREAGSFSGVKVSSGVDVYLTQGDKESITVEADENLHQYIETEIRNGELNVFTEVNIRDAERKRVYVTMKEIKTVRTSSAGDVVGETPVKADRLELSASSAGNINLEVTADLIDIDISSSGDVTIKGKANLLEASLSSAGDLNAYDLEVKDAEVSASSAGDANIYVTGTLKARASSAGDISYRGNPQSVDARSSSAGSIHRRQ